MYLYYLYLDVYIYLCIYMFFFVKKKIKVNLKKFSLVAVLLISCFRLSQKIIGLQIQIYRYITKGKS